MLSSFWGLTIALWLGSVAAQSTSSSTALATNLATYCKGVNINSIMALSLDRAANNNATMKLLQVFANGTMNFITSPNPGSAFLGVLPPLMIPILLMVAFLVSFSFAIGFFFPHFCTARKEDITVAKQRVFFYLTFFFIITLTACFGFLWFYIIQAVTQVNNTACLYYKAQYELTVGYTSAPYQFIGFDNFNDGAAIFQQELGNFASLASSFQSLNAMNFQSFTSNMNSAVQNYSNTFAGQQITAIDGTKQRPIVIQSLTSAISNDVSAEIATIVALCQSLANIATYGLATLTTYGQNIGVLIQTLTNTITVVVTQFQTVISVLQPYDGSVSTVVSLMNNTKIILAVLLVLTFAFVPYFLAFYALKNSTDSHDWMVYPAKVVVLLLAVLGIVITVLFFFVLSASTISSSVCYYMDGLLTNQTKFNQEYLRDLHVTDPNINATLSFCFNQSTSNFVSFLAASNNNNGNSGPNSTIPVRKIPVAINRTNGPPTTTSNSTSTTSSPTVQIGPNIARRLLGSLFIPTWTDTDSIQAWAAGFRALQSTTTTPTTNTTNTTTSTNTTNTTNTTNAANATNGTNFTISNFTIPNPPPGFNMTALLLFQAFVTALNSYVDFYQSASSSASPSIQSFLSTLNKMSTGQLNNFVEYDIAINQLFNAVKCNSSTVVLNGQNCQANYATCNVVTELSVFAFSQRVAAAPCVVNPAEVINIYNNLQLSWQSGIPLYTNMSNTLLSNQTNGTNPGNLIQNARQAILNASQVIANIEDYISSTLAWFNQFNGDLTGMTSCYIAKKQLLDFEPAMCFQLQGSLTYVTIFFLGIVLSLLFILWGIFYSIKYSGNLTIASWASATTQGSGWDRSKMTAVSFMEQSEIVLNEKSDIQDSDDEKSYFDKEGGPKDDAASDVGSDDDD